MASKVQAIVDAAENLGILGEGEKLPSYESDDLSRAYTEVYAELQALRLTTWAETANIPDQYSWSVAMLMAEQRMVKYKVPTNRVIELVQGGATAMMKIRALQARSKMGQTEIEYF